METNLNTEATNATQLRNSVVQSCVKTIDGILSLNAQRFASLILFPLSDLKIRKRLRDHYLKKGFAVKFCIAAGDTDDINSPDRKYYIDIYKTGGIIKSQPKGAVFAEKDKPVLKAMAKGAGR